jgi:hypothetical protein
MILLLPECAQRLGPGFALELLAVEELVADLAENDSAYRCRKTAKERCRPSPNSSADDISGFMGGGSGSNCMGVPNTS